MIGCYISVEENMLDLELGTPSGYWAAWESGEASAGKFLFEDNEIIM